MKKVQTFLKVVGYTAVVLFIAVFIYANWKPLTLGEEICMKNPTQLLILRLPQDFSKEDSVRFTNYTKSETAIKSTVINLRTKLTCLTLDAHKTNRKAMLAFAKGFENNITERPDLGGKECPVNLLVLHQIRYALNIRG